MHPSIHSSDTVYIAGPMTGYPFSNYPAFNRMETYIQDRFDCRVVNPASNFGGDPNLPREAYLREDFGNLTTQCTAVVFLPGWEKSQGAIKEYLIASELKLKMYDHLFNEIEPFNQTLTFRKINNAYGL